MSDLNGRKAQGCARIGLVAGHYGSAGVARNRQTSRQSGEVQAGRIARTKQRLHQRI